MCAESLFDGLVLSPCTALGFRHHCATTGILKTVQGRRNRGASTNHRSCPLKITLFTFREAEVVVIK